MLTPVSLCRCLGDETRLQIVLMLAQQTELCVCDLVDSLAVPQPTASRHLAKLRDAGLLMDRRQGQWIYYRLSDQLPPWARDCIAALSEPGKTLYKRTLQRAACC
ncbi:MAG: transcriptional regulator [Gammaproteobacteria bacterium HGW-Gammaproteobacteria-14]|nr:MAG: transcriptional regulator [Gammaproteobacteria bacterium HGW-Gammaproteobacteria-14]